MLSDVGEHNFHYLQERLKQGISYAHFAGTALQPFNTGTQLSVSASRRWMYILYVVAGPPDGIIKTRWEDSYCRHEH